MNLFILSAGMIIVICILLNKLSNKIGMPILLAFIVLGMLLGSDGITGIPFDDYVLANQISSVALIFIIFYGGFCTNWKEAKPVLPQAVILSSAGTLMTAGLVGVFCFYILRINVLESFLIGAVISSTDAASVFSILRSRRLNLRYHTASLLEIESGSNDPFSYMLTVIILAMISGEGSGRMFLSLFFTQLAAGILFGFGVAFLAYLFLKKIKIATAEFTAMFVVAVALIAYAAPSSLNGNGYLSAYIAGIILGNCQIDNKHELVHFFDGVTGLMQMLLFFSLGLLSFPSELPAIAFTALLIALFLTFIARPVAVFVILAPFRSHLRQKLLIAWAGMRGAASIVFAIMTVISPAETNHDVFHIVFFIVLFSILIQGSLLPVLSKKLNMINDKTDVMKTFNDYVNEVPVQFIQFELPEGHTWEGRKVKEISLPPELIIAMVERGGEKIIPGGSTRLHAHDIIILGGAEAGLAEDIGLSERKVEKGDNLSENTIAELDFQDHLIIMIKRESHVIIPKGNTVLKEDDILILTNQKKRGTK